MTRYFYGSHLPLQPGDILVSESSDSSDGHWCGSQVILTTDTFDSSRIHDARERELASEEPTLYALMSAERRAEANMLVARMKDAAVKEDTYVYEVQPLAEVEPDGCDVERRRTDAAKVLREA